MKKLIALIVIVIACVLIYKFALGGPFRKGKEAFSAGDYEAAEANFQQAVEGEKKVYESLVYLARINGINGNLEQGIGGLDKAIGIRPKGSKAFYYKAVLLQLAGRMSEAEAVLDEFSNMPQAGKGFLIANLRNPRPGSSEDLRPEERAWRVEVLKGKAY